MSPRNEFQAGDREVPGADEEDLSQEVEPVEVDPHLWPEDVTAELWPEAKLADLRKDFGLTTTEAHIAESRRKRQSD